MMPRLMWYRRRRRPFVRLYRDHPVAHQSLEIEPAERFVNRDLDGVVLGNRHVDHGGWLPGP